MVQPVRIAIGILSLSGSKHNLLMWAHYADHHQGIVVGFDANHPFFNQTVHPKKGSIKHDLLKPFDIELDCALLGKVFPVRYERIRMENNSAHIHIGIDALLQKSDEWIYEKEYRMFMRISDCDQYGDNKDGTGELESALVNLFQIPEAAITRIIIGCYANRDTIVEDFKKALDKNANLSHIKLEYASPHKDLYHLEHIGIKL